MFSPFNVGVEIRLDDLTLARTAELVTFLEWSGATVDADVAARVHRWTGGSVYLEQAILESLWDLGGPGRRIGGADVDATAVQVVARAPAEIHFQNIYNRLAERRPVLDGLRAWLAGRAIDPGVVQSLRIAGLSGEAPYRNDIYRQVFGGVGSLALIRPRTNDQNIISVNIESAEIRLFPNPTKGIIEIHGKNIDNGTIRVTDNVGRLIKLQKLSGYKQIDISDMPNGIYFIYILTDSQSTALGIIKE